MVLAFGLILTFGCSPRRPSDAVEDSLTSGRIRVVCAPEAQRLIEAEVAAFQALYPKAQLELSGGNSRQATAALFAARTDLAVITSELSPEERAAAVRGGLELEGYRFARDAVVMIAHRDNPVENLALDDLRRILRGTVHRWSDLGGPDAPIEMVIQPPASDVTDFLADKVLGGESLGIAARTAADDSAVVAEVRRNPNALGYVTLGARTDAVRVLRLAPLSGLAYTKPDLEAVYRDQYPLTRFYSCYIRNDGPRLAGGFVTFVTSRDGQALVHQHGLVPTAVPVRFVRRSPMVGTH